MTNDEWNSCTDRKGDIDLVLAYLHAYPSRLNNEPAKKYLRDIMDFRPIRSRQAAALAIATAATLPAPGGYEDD